MSPFKNYLQTILKNERAPLHREEVASFGNKLLLEEKDFAVIEVHGPQKKAPLILSCGIHGNETAPIEILNDILAAIALGEQKVGRPLLLIFGHVEAMRQNKRFIDFNMNRLFNGQHRYYPHAMEGPRARRLEELMDSFLKNKSLRPWHLDLHTAIRPSHVTRFAIFPHQENKIPTQEELTLLQNLDIDAILLANGKASTFSAHSCENYGAYGYTLELGKVFPFGKNPHQKFIAVKEGLKSFIEGDQIFQQIAPSSQEPVQYRVVRELIRDHEHYKLHLRDDYANFTPLPPGTVIETLKEGETIIQEESAVVFPNPEVPIGQRSGLLVSKVNKSN